MNNKIKEQETESRPEERSSEQVKAVRRSKPLTKKQRRMVKILDQMKNYVNTYDSQTGWEDYSDETFIKDMLYGVGLAVDRKKYEWSDGFLLFKKKILSKYI